jgi:heme exporter protein A
VTEPVAITAVDLTRYYGERAALENVSFELPAGGTLVVFGANGAGKTTLLRILATLLRPHDGELTVLGERLPKDAWAVRGRVGMIGHDAMIYRDLTARENLRLTARLHCVGRDAADQLLERLELAGRADEPVRNFSRGMLQRLATARAMLPDPELLLLDEPLANLDPGAAELLEPFIGPASGRTRVVVTHDVEFGIAQADIALGLVRGRSQWLLPREQITDADVRRLYR